MRKIASVFALGFCLLMLGCAARDSGAYDRGMDALSRGDYSAAVQEFQTAADQDGRKAEAYRGQGIASLRQGDYAGAIALFSQSLEEMKHSNRKFRRDVLLYQAEAYEKNRQSSQAGAIYDQLIKEDKDAVSYVLRGGGKLQEGDAQGAREDFERALEQETTYQICLQIYQVCTEANREADGAEYLERALELTPEGAEESRLQAQVYYYLGDYQKAQAGLSAAAEDGDEDSLRMLGSLYLETGETAGARTLYENALEEGSHPAAAYNGLALCDILEEDYESALRNIRQGISCRDESVMRDLLYNEIVVYERQLDFETAQSKMREFLERYPGDEEALRENQFLQSR